MSINYCTISTNTLDGFCGNQRAKVLAHLLDEKYAVVNPPTPHPGGGGGGVGIGHQGQWGQWSNIPGIQHNIPQVPRYEPPRIDRDLPAYEQPWITVVVSNFLGDLRGEQTLNATPQVEFVTVTNLDFEDTDISVNITGLEM